MNTIVAGLSDVERRAAALADITKMHDAMTVAAEQIGQLRADLHREQDRCSMLVEERDRHRHEALRLRKLLIELATQMSNISLLAVKAQDVIAEIDEMDAAVTPSTEAIDKLEKIYAAGAVGLTDELGKLQAGAPSPVDGKR